MSTQKLTDYERKRLENIKRNDDMLAALKIPSKLSKLKDLTKRPRPQQKSFKVGPEKKQRTEIPEVLRRSCRARRVPPDASTVGDKKDDFDEKGPIRLRDAYICEGTGKKLVKTILQCSRKDDFKDNGMGSCKPTNDKGENQKFASSMAGRKICSSFDVEGLSLEPENIARVVDGRIFTLKFFPTTDVSLVVVGNTVGDLGFWNVYAGDDNIDNGIYVYHPHTGQISGIMFDSFTFSRIFTSSYDRCIRMMDVEKKLFDLVYFSDKGIFSLSGKPDDVKSLYFGEGRGDIRIWDLRSGKSSSSWSLHRGRINTIDFNSQNTNIMATSSTDGTVAIWDLRSNSMCKPKSLKKIKHKKSVDSAYFSPSGKLLATTSVDERVGLFSGINYDELSMIYHNSQTGRFNSLFRGIWGWDDSHIFIGNMGKGVDVISTYGNEMKVVTTLKSERLKAIPARFDAHPYEVGMLAGATRGGEVYIWKQPS